RSTGRGSGASTEILRLDDVVDQALSDLEMAIEEADARVTRSDLPVVSGDARQLVEVFEHLIENALKFGGTEPPVINIEAAEGADEYLVSVQDNDRGNEPAEDASNVNVIVRLDSVGSHLD